MLAIWKEKHKNTLKQFAKLIKIKQTLKNKQNSKIELKQSKHK